MRAPLRYSSVSSSIHVGEFETRINDHGHFATLHLDVIGRDHRVGELCLFVESGAEARLLRHAFDCIKNMRRQADFDRKRTEVSA